MSIQVALNHVTHYRYDRLVKLGPQVVRLRPAPHCRTPIVSYSLRIEPANHFINWQQDPFANYLARLVFPEATREFKITVDLVADLAVFNPFDFFLEPSAEEFPFQYDSELGHDLAPYLVKSEATPRFAKFLETVDLRKRRTIDFLVYLNQRLANEIRYLIRMEPGVQTPEETLASAAGSCRDSGWLLVQTMRHLGLAARFVSGYLIQLKADVKALDGPSGASADFTDLHAWCEVYLPGAGWVGLDPTSGLMAGEGHIPLACTPEPGSAAPVTGAVDFSEVEFNHSMSVTRIYESPRVTLPYTDAQWTKVLALGDAVDADLQTMDVRLTMGGEPTFVAIENREEPEWNTAALGPTKRKYSVELIERLRERYGANGFLHFGQGKWYPGEQLPRWALSLYWRADGLACWHDEKLLANDSEPSAYTVEDARRFIECLARQLGLNARYVVPGYEDVWNNLWRERRLPINVDPFDSKLADSAERERLRRLFEQGLDKVVGYVLPIKRERRVGLAGTMWLTGRWHFREGRMYLTTGDSPMGYRLPLDSLPWVTEGDFPYDHEEDPFGPQGALPAASLPAALYAEQALSGEKVRGGAHEHGGNLATELALTADRDPKLFESAGWITRTALCVEVREGVLYVFMPPLPALADYLDMVSAVEAAAAELKVKLVIEGYQPPRDPRLKMLQVTPDPGVIEVNIHPSSNWKQLVDNAEFLYHTAHQLRLTSEKFMLDGRHVGTGGGNHFVLGGATPADSPFLRRPEVLTSLIGYWHNHPSLSYLFSGMFIGPTSQAPRVDEARNDQIYELEIAFRELRRQQEKQGSAAPPWLVDRALRNILIDVTGNTHRSEFCIDKLYSPDGPTGRLGLLEMRAFEMPPHARMSLSQQLLIRALLARFWKTPYVAPLTRWGTELHDRFMLPTFIAADFADVLTELRSVGYEFDPAWFAPHLEFRFPLIGDVIVNGIQLTLRTALEPWHVMGEESGAGTTVRYVDSSLERIEVRVTGLNDARYAVTVNGRAVPLQPGNAAGEFIAGVRYRAWQPYSALHPTIGVHAPLTFDLVDTWMERSLGGCRYHVAHPGGRSHESFPVNAYEAESRRLARFFKTGHTPGKMQVKPAHPSREFPFTLDLRRD